ncbi:unnamed protein product, partial [Amoebophrya sp. A120]|eukprot:GSA120T00000711001.1
MRSEKEDEDLIIMIDEYKRDLEFHRKLEADPNTINLLPLSPTERVLMPVLMPSSLQRERDLKERRDNIIQVAYRHFPRDLSLAEENLVEPRPGTGFRSARGLLATPGAQVRVREVVEVLAN